MTSTTPQQRTHVVVVAALVAVTAASTTALVLRSGDGGLPAQVRGAFIGFWRAGVAEPGPDLRHVLDQWQREQATDAAIALVLVVALLALARTIAGRRQAPHPTSRTFAFLAAAAAGALAAAWVLVSSLQGTIAPLGASLPALVERSPSPRLATVLGEVEQQLAAARGTADLRLPLRAMVDDYAAFHVVRAVGLTPVALALVAAGLVLWRRREDVGGPAAPWRAAAVACWSAAAFCVVVVLANLTTVADPVPGLLGLFRGDW